MLIFAVACFLTALATLAALDLWDLRTSRPTAGDAEPVRAGTVAFLVAVTCLFLAVQSVGGWLTPDTLTLLALARLTFGGDENSSAAAPLAGWKLAAMGVILFYTAGLWDYLVHRHLSHSRWLWFTHEYHHLPRRVSVLMPGILARPFAFLPTALATLMTGATLYAGMACLGLPRWDLEPLLPAMLAIVVVLTASHSSFLRRRPWVHGAMKRLFLTTPQEHLLHHAVGMPGNYGNFTTLWDRVFGTYVDPAGVALEEVPLGLPYDQDFLGVLTLGRRKLPAAVRRRFQVERYCNVDLRQEG
jgi:sterol desaturase/sphingolipid hydroxylase (fatty acid hydroxylase superfamily)